MSKAVVSRPSIRPLVSRDEATVAHVLEQLSAEQRWQRFHAAVPRLAPRLLRHLADVDDRDRVALVLRLGRDPVGIGHYYRVTPTAHGQRADSSSAHAHSHGWTAARRSSGSALRRPDCVEQCTSPSSPTPASPRWTWSGLSRSCPECRGPLASSSPPSGVATGPTPGAWRSWRTEVSARSPRPTSSWCQEALPGRCRPCRTRRYSPGCERTHRPRCGSPRCAPALSYSERPDCSRAGGPRPTGQLWTTLLRSGPL